MILKGNERSTAKRIISLLQSYIFPIVNSLYYIGNLHGNIVTLYHKEISFATLRSIYIFGNVKNLFFSI